MVVALLPVSVVHAATSGTCGSNLTWTLDDEGTLTIRGTGNMTNWTGSTMPQWYSSNTIIKAIVISDAVTSIGSFAFAKCSGCTSVTIPKSVTSIGSNAFLMCYGLKRVYITDISAYLNCEYGDRQANPMNIASELYLNGEKASGEIAIPNGVKQIQERAFYGCAGLTGVTIPNSVTSIGGGAFIGCTGLTSVTIPDSVTSIGGSAFSGCAGLTSVTIPDSVTSIGGSAFSACAGLTGVTIPDSVTSIVGNTFYGCTGLTSVTLPDSVTSIGISAFYGCTGLTEVTIQGGITSIGEKAFIGCNSLKKIRISDLAAWCSATGGFNNPTFPLGLELYLNDDLVTELVIPEGVTSIGSFRFRGFYDITSVTIPNTVTSIATAAFESCTGLTSVNIPDSVTLVDSSVFTGCVGLTNITVPSSLTSIGYRMFANCTGLTRVTIPDGVTSIGTFAFAGCMGLSEIVIPDSVTSISSSAFENCIKLKHIFYLGSEEKWNSIGGGEQNVALNSVTKIYNAEKKTYKLETNCDNTLSDVTDYAIFEKPSVENGNKRLTGWYDNAALSGEAVSFPYYGSAEKLYAKWENIGCTKTAIQTMQGGSKLFIVTPTDLPTGSTIILALYNGGELVDLQTAENQNSAVYFLSSADYTDARVMAWDSLSAMGAVCDAEMVK